VIHFSVHGEHNGANHSTPFLSDIHFSERLYCIFPTLTVQIDLSVMLCTKSDKVYY